MLQALGLERQPTNEISGLKSGDTLIFDRKTQLLSIREKEEVRPVYWMQGSQRDDKKRVPFIQIDINFIDFVNTVGMLCGLTVRFETADESESWLAHFN